jgi:hypothetical protein
MQNSYQSPVLNGGYYDVPIQNAYSNQNMMANNYPQVGESQFNPMIQNNYPQGGYTVQPSNLESFVGSRESTFKYVSNSGYNSNPINPYAMSISHSNDQFPAQVYTNTGVQLRVDPRMSSSKIEDSAYKAKSQMMGGGYGQQFMPNNPFTMPQMGMNMYGQNPSMGMNYHNPSSGMGMWSFEPPFAEQGPTFPAVPAYMPQVFNPNPYMGQQMMGPNMYGGQNMMYGGGQGGQRPTPNIRIRDDDEDAYEAGDDEVIKAKRNKATPIKSLEKRESKQVKKNRSTLEKVNDFLTDNSTIYWLIVLLVILVVAFVVKALYVDK